jgi:predicted nucleotidyltransferase component of viral defense system
MIPQAEIKKKAEEWEVPATTVEKDHALGHFLAGFIGTFKNRLRFKGGTCLRKCYFPEYRFSEDLDFSSVAPEFILQAEELATVCEAVEKHSGIIFRPEPVEPLLHQDKRKGEKVIVRFWGANHSRHEAPSPPERWHSKIKLEISTEEILVLPPSYHPVIHPYSDQLVDHGPVACYSLTEVVAEKLRSLVQRSYAAPRDYYDLYMLTGSYTQKDWNELKPVFLAKMAHKKITYDGPLSLISETSVQHARRAWHNSIAHQLKPNDEIRPEQMIEAVRDRILKYL